MQACNKLSTHLPTSPHDPSLPCCMLFVLPAFPACLLQLRSPQRPLHQLPPFMQTPVAWRRPVSAESPALPALFPLSPVLLRPPPLGQLDQLPANLLQLLGLGPSGAPGVPPPPPVSMGGEEHGNAAGE